MLSIFIYVSALHPHLTNADSVSSHKNQISQAERQNRKHTQLGLYYYIGS